MQGLMMGDECSRVITSPRRDHRNAPVRWMPRYNVVLDLYLAGKRTSDIAEQLGYSAHRVSMITKSAIFEQKTAKRLAELQGTDAAAFLEEIRREAVANLRFLVAKRDDESLPTHERLSAARQIERAVDRVLPCRGSTGVL